LGWAGQRPVKPRCCLLGDFARARQRGLNL